MQLTAQICACESVGELCALIEHRSLEFNHVNVATAFRKLLPASKSTRGSIQQALEMLEQRAMQTMEVFEPQGIANVLHMMAKKSYTPTNAALLPGLEKQAEKVSSTFKPQEIANTLWAIAKLGRRPGMRLIDSLEGRLRDVADEFNAEKVSNTLWAYATGRTHRRKDQESRAAIQTAGDHKHSVGIRHPAATAGRGGDGAHV